MFIEKSPFMFVTDKLCQRHAEKFWQVVEWIETNIEKDSVLIEVARSPLQDYQLCKARPSSEIRNKRITINRAVIEFYNPEDVMAFRLKWL